MFSTKVTICHNILYNIAFTQRPASLIDFLIMFLALILFSLKQGKDSHLLKNRTETRVKCQFHGPPGS